VTNTQQHVMGFGSGTSWPTVRHVITWYQCYLASQTHNIHAHT